MSLPRSTPFVGILEDIKVRAPLYLSDFEHYDKIKMYASILFTFFASVGPAITFASLLRSETKNEVGAVEVLLSSSIGGMIMSLFAGQPLVIVGVTGPVSILTISIYRLTQSWGIEFLPFYAWAQIWGAIMHIVFASMNFCDTVLWITRFSGEIFGVLIAIIYLYTGFADMYKAYANNGATFESGLLAMVVTLGMAWTSMKLYKANEWLVFSTKIREVISDYGATISLILFTGLVYLPGARDVDIDKLEVPSNFDTSSGRAWFVDLTQTPLWAVFAAIFPGMLITCLFFFDHNISSLMAQAAEFKLRKPPAFHLDFFVLGICLFITGLLGIPPTNGLIPQAPLHTKSLVVIKYLNVEEERTPVVMGTLEQRWSNFMQAALAGLMCFQPFLGLLGLVPISALSGLFIFMGAASFIDNQFAERVALICTQKKLRRCSDEFFTRCSMADIQKFTGIQLFICLFIFAITFTPADMVFPLLIGVLVPFRLFYMPQWFEAESLKYLDPLEPNLFHALSEEQRSEGGEDILKHIHEADEILAHMQQGEPLEEGEELSGTGCITSANNTPCECDAGGEIKGPVVLTTEVELTEV